MASQLPDHFPISLEIMSDPVILSSGHTFDRSSIQRWLDAGHRTCPITKLPLPDDSFLIPNYALPSLISTYTLLHHPPPQPETLISTLTSPSSSPHSKTESLHHITRLSKRDPLFRCRLSDSAVVAAVLSCVDSADDSLREKALSLLLNLSLDDDNKAGLVAVLTCGSSDCRAVAATMMTSLAVLEVNKATIGAYPHAIGALVTLVRDGKGREKKEAATALYALCCYPFNRKKAVECGAVSVLLESADCGLERAVEVIGVLAKCREGRVQMERFDVCVQILARVLRNGTSRGVQYALMALNSLCYNSERSVVEAMQEGGFGNLCRVAGT